MTRTMRHISLMAALTVLLLSCTTSKSLYKDALKYEEAGMYDDAVNSLERSLDRRYMNTDARVKLKQIGQKAFNMKLDEFNRHMMLKNYEQAIHNYGAVTRFQSELRKYQVQVDIPSHYTREYEVAKEVYLSELYESGVDLMEKDDFDQAEDVFDRIMDIDPFFRDVRDLKEGAECEPIYRAAMSQFERGEYREAYYGFLTCARKGDYKEANEYMAVCLEFGQITVAMLPLENQTGKNLPTNKLQAYALEALVKIDDPFLRVVERENLDQVIQEQNFNLSGSVSESATVEAGNLTGASTILTGEIVDYQLAVGSLKRIKKKGFVSYKVTKTNEDGSKRVLTKYKAVEYYEYEDRNRVAISFHFKLLDVETAEIVTADIVHREEIDQIRYASFNGDHAKLLPAKSDGSVDLNYRNRNKLRDLLSSRKNLRSVSDLADDLQRNIASTLARRVEDELR